MILDVGLAMTVLPVVVFNPVAGDQEYDEAPEATSVVEEPLQIVADEGATEITGRLVTLIKVVLV